MRSAARGALKPVLHRAFQSALKTGVNGHLRAAILEHEECAFGACALLGLPLAYQRVPNCLGTPAPVSTGKPAGV